MKNRINELEYYWRDWLQELKGGGPDRKLMLYLTPVTLLVGSIMILFGAKSKTALWVSSLVAIPLSYIVILIFLGIAVYSLVTLFI